jgi:hypothetical protein
LRFPLSGALAGIMISASFSMCFHNPCAEFRFFDVHSWTGFYETRIAYYSWRGYKGYSYSRIPAYWRKGFALRFAGVCSFSQYFQTGNVINWWEGGEGHDDLLPIHWGQESKQATRT